MIINEEGGFFSKNNNLIKTITMIYLLHGQNTDKAREKLHTLVDPLRAKKPDASVFKMDSDSFELNELQERIVGQGLFEQKHIVVLDNVFDGKENKEVILKNIKEVGSSENIFIILEKKLDKKTINKIEKHSVKVQEFAGGGVIQKKKEFNIFALSDAFGKRDKKQSWVIFHKALASGLVAESIHGTVFWGVKSMLLAKDAKTAGEAGMAPFVFSKSKSASKNFKEGELEDISSLLVSIYHDAHAGGMEMSVALELFLLSH